MTDEKLPEVVRVHGFRDKFGIVLKDIEPEDADGLYGVFLESTRDADGKIVKVGPFWKSQADFLRTLNRQMGGVLPGGPINDIADAIAQLFEEGEDD